MQLLQLFLLFQVRVDNGIPEGVWMTKRDSIAKEIRVLSVGYRQILRDGWVHYRSQKNAAGGPGQSARRVETAIRVKIVVDDEA